MQQLILQRQQQQLLQQHQRREGGHLLNGTGNVIDRNNSLTRQNSGTANALATKMYEEKLKPPVQRDSLDEAAVKVYIMPKRIIDSE